MKGCRGGVNQCISAQVHLRLPILQPHASLLRPARGVEEVGRLVWSATTCFPFRHHADLIESRRFEEAREFVHREVVGHIEHLATVVSREVGVSLAGQRKVFSV